MRSISTTIMMAALSAAVGVPIPKAASVDSASQHVVLISIDGLVPAYYLEPDDHGLEIPNLRALMEAGTFAEGMIGVLPTLTYPSHTTLVTGVPPAKHGIVRNWIQRRDWYLDAGAIRVPTLWDVAVGSGLTTAAVTWPVTYGARLDIVIPENLKYGPVDDVAKFIRAGSTPGLFEDLENATGKVELLPFEHPEAGLLLDRMTTDFGAEVIKRYKPNLLLLHFLDLDHRQHAHGPASAAALEAFERTDTLIGELRAAVNEAGIGESTTFFIVSDHGFIQLHTWINIARVFAGIHSSTPLSEVFSVIVTGGTAAIQVNESVEPEVVDEVLSAFRTEIDTRYDGIIDWITAEETEAMGGFPGAALALSAQAGYAFDYDPSIELLMVPSLDKGMHGYRPDDRRMHAAFIASGAGIRRLGRIPTIRILDVAPTVATLMGLSLSEATGFPLVAILESNHAR